MSKPFPPKVVTANALLKGDVVYLTANDDWSPNLSDAEVIEDEAHATIRLLDGTARQAEVVGVYLADVKVGTQGPEPVHFREAFRARGPSNLFHGKQADSA
ncbi:MAG: DUF2849 domain-containing protein [Rhodobacteraceae bacterium]|jgi:hypothetical protein|nr:DUF2849 domain-containing protein [Paracoccaceae bacterium]